MNESMFRKSTLSAVFATVVLAAGQHALAQQSGTNMQQHSGTNTQQSTKTAAATPAAPAAGVIPLGVTRIETDLVTPGYRASKLIGQEVYNEAGQKIGKVGDLVIAPDGTLSVAVIDVGGFVGLGKHRVAIPVKQLTQVHPKVILPGATKEALKQLPEFIPA
jgi:sporulation protein YlmC with PRC-barrel domain